ncbi:MULTISPECIES: LysE family translocator [Pseudomonas syringae group]|uniref:Lysine exporter protein LysE/YggA n=1 Tax=Pseudomonas syringae pv. japonica str. M301072 TaxID=629262 RepID=F3FJN6_PSESX|nr:MULTISPECIES: LysE family translocator [Pseudomonas syringae group]EGH30422.1 lysine exporter protein LysE/YggA [Pseudomonas syringae pv. japonica str. M301072]ELP95845.1 lysine exporter protein LysE/YggA [Pseudomonas syringae BRIP34881]ELP96301.1 lysine exporter protein LysE/YggA [Pseudomonas syringae BRIP34876]ELS40809.1 Homoserine/lysine/threonine efflux protein, LysE/YggA family [Pseudomonas syringae pv. syringae B64]MBI6709329.1 LysE family translocator [Pseudomonas syringae]
MDISTLAVFIPACFALNMAPGPNNLLSISNATRYGFASSCVGGAGRLLAFVIMIALAGAGLTAVLHTSEWLFHVIKVVGAAYLFYLAVQLWRADPAIQNQAEVAPANAGSLARQEFLVAIGNPKAILLFTAFLPQFVDHQSDVSGQFAVLGGLFLVLECVAIALYAAMGIHARRLLAKPSGKRLFNRVCAGLLAGAASVLLVSRRA